MKKILLPVLTAAVIFLFYNASPYSDQPAEDICLIRPSVNDIRDMTVLQGTIKDPSPIRLYAEGPAEVLEVLVQPGDTVWEGQPVLRLLAQDPLHDPQEIAASALFQLEQSLKEGEFAAAQAMLDGIKASNSPNPDTTSGSKVYQLYSPVSGIVMETFCDQNDMLSGLIPCMELCDTQGLQVQAEVDEALIGVLSEKMLCEVTVPAFSSKVLRGNITSIKPYARQTGFLSGNAAAKTTVAISLNSPEELRPGYRAEVRVMTAYKSGALLIPYESVGQDDTGEYVLIVENNTIVKQYILTGSELENRVEVTNGLTPESVLLLDPKSAEEGDLINYADSGSADAVCP